MNYTNRFISFTVLAAILSSCEFNEDFCIRNGIRKTRIVCLWRTRRRKS